MRIYFAYPATILDEGADGITVTFDDIPEAITGAFDHETARAQASDALDEALAGRIRRGDDIPTPSPAHGRPLIDVGALIAAKAAFYLAAKASGMGPSALATHLEMDRTDLRRMLNPRHGTKIESINAALERLGARLVVGVRDAA